MLFARKLIAFALLAMALVAAFGLASAQYGGGYGGHYGGGRGNYGYNGGRGRGGYGGGRGYGGRGGYGGGRGGYGGGRFRGFHDYSGYGHNQGSLYGGYGGRYDEFESDLGDNSLYGGYGGYGGQGGYGGDMYSGAASSAATTSSSSAAGQSGGAAGAASTLDGTLSSPRDQAGGQPGWAQRDLPPQAGPAGANQWPQGPSLPPNFDLVTGGERSLGAEPRNFQLDDQQGPQPRSERARQPTGGQAAGELLAPAPPSSTTTPAPEYVMISPARNPAPMPAAGSDQDEE